jgi:hypothetical protein
MARNFSHGFMNQSLAAPKPAAARLWVAGVRFAAQKPSLAGDKSQVRNPVGQPVGRPSC